MRAAMAEASRIVLDGFELGTDVSIIRWPDRYMDDRGRVMWDRVQKLDSCEGRQENGMTLRRMGAKFTMFPDAWDYQLAKIRADGCTYRVAIYLLRDILAGRQ